MHDSAEAWMKMYQATQLFYPDSGQTRLLRRFSVHRYERRPFYIDLLIMGLGPVSRVPNQLHFVQGEIFKDFLEQLQHVDFTFLLLPLGALARIHFTALLD